VYRSLPNAELPDDSGGDGYCEACDEDISKCGHYPEEEPVDQKPSIGRIVHYVIKEGRSAGCHRPAFIVNCFGPDVPHVNLQVFLDYGNDDGSEFTTLDQITRQTYPLTGHVYSAPYDPEGKLPGSWHWPERE
jgi:hypothetical protein